MKQTRNLQQKKTGERWKIVKPIRLQRDFLEVTGNRASYHYSLCKKHLYRGLYIKSCSADVSAIKRIQANICKHQTFANLFENTYSRCGAGLLPGNSPAVSFTRIFSIRNLFSGTPESAFNSFFFFFFGCNVSYSLCFCLFLQKIRRSVLFSTS